MPKQFTGSIENPTQRFGADEFVDTSNPLEQLPGAAQAFAKATSSLVVRSYSQQQQDEINRQEELYTQARAAKKGLYEGAIAQDQQAVSEYAQKLEDLKVAERQGAITGTNSSIRQETLLKSYINRFPHLEEDFRQSFSVTRARAQAQREQFKDPIEVGMDRFLEEAYSSGMNPVRYVEYKQGKMDLEMKKEMLSYRSMLGQSIEGEVDVLFENQGRVGAVMDVQNMISEAVNATEQSGQEFNADQFRMNALARKEMYKRDFRLYLADIVSKSDTPDAVLSKDYVNLKMSELDQIYDDQLALIDSFDTLKVMDRASKVSELKTLKEISDLNPLFGLLVKANPQIALDTLLKGFDRTKRAVESGNMAALQLLKDKSTDYESGLIDFHLKLLKQTLNDGRALARDFDASLNKGAALAPSGSPYVDAARTNLVTQTVLGSDQFDEEQKASTVRSALSTEKQLSRPGEYLAPNSTWYTDPIKSQALRDNEQAKVDMTKTLDNDAPGIIRSVQDPRELSSFNFAPQLEQDLTMGEPWKAYPTGGPWSSSLLPASQSMTPQFAGSFIGRMARGSQNVPGSNIPKHSGGIATTIGALNNDYWIYRQMHGASAAEEHAMEIMDLINQSIQEAGEREAEKDAGPSTRSGPRNRKDPQTVDLTD